MTHEQFNTIMQFYAEPTPLPSPPPFIEPEQVIRNRWIIPTPNDVEWAWGHYSDPATFVSLKILARHIGCSSSVLRNHLIRRFGTPYRQMARRRSYGGDLY